MNFFKFLFFTVLFATFANAGLINAISLTINNEPITLYEIHKIRTIYKVSVDEAIDLLIQQRLEESEIKRLGIVVDDFDVKEEIKKIASSNSLSVFDFLDMLKSRGIDKDDYEKELKEKLKKQMLYRKIVSQRAQRPSDEEMLRYYKNNKDEFSSPELFEVTKYISSSKEALLEAIKNPMKKFQEVNVIDEKIETKNINPKLLYILNKTKEASFTPVITIADNFVAFYIKKKLDIKTLPFDEVKNEIFAKLANKREKEIIREYFDKIKAEANIRMIRKPSS
jgi:hypothetical protein